MALSVMVPVSITSSILTSSTVTETDFSVWSSATTYALGDKCISTTTHRIYQSAVAGNLNKDPTVIATQVPDISNITYWTDIAPTNKWAMFDTTVSTVTDTTSPLTVVINAGAFNGVYLGGLDADALSITIKDAPGGTIIYNSGSITLEGSTPPDYYEYFFDKFIPSKTYLITNLDSYATAEITVTLTKVAGNIKCGILALGDLIPLGTTLNGATAKPKTYSYIDTNAFGVTTIKRRKATTDMTLTAFLATSEATTVLTTVQNVLDIPCVWVASECTIYNGLTIFGLGSADLNYKDASTSELSLTVQGLI